MLKELTILVIENNTAVRSRLMAALNAGIQNPVIDIVRKTASGIEKLSGPTSYDLVIVRSSKDTTPIRDVITACERAPGATPPLVLVSLKASEQDSTYVAQLFLAGVHGLLCEPFSPDQLLENITTARERATANIDQKKKSALAAGFLAADALKIIDQVAQGKIAGRGVGYEMRDLKQLTQGLTEISANIDPANFVEMVSSKVKDAKPSGRVFKSKLVDVKPKAALHPGHFVELALKERGITQEKLIGITTLKAHELALLIEQKTGLSDEAAREISRALGKTAKYWLKLQTDYDKYQASLAKT